MAAWLAVNLAFTHQCEIFSIIFEPISQANTVSVSSGCSVAHPTVGPRDAPEGTWGRCAPSFRETLGGASPRGVTGFREEVVCQDEECCASGPHGPTTLADTTPSLGNRGDQGD